jgi:hypothetical protein
MEADLEALPWPQRKFLEFAERNPECREPASFALEVDELAPYPLQPWPFFMGSRQVAGLARACVGVCDLMRVVPQRVFGGDPVRLAEYYEMPVEVASLTVSLIERAGLDGTVARGDFVLTAEGFKTCEINMAASLGGAESGEWARRVFEVPVVRRFISEEGFGVSWRDPLRTTFLHLVEEAERHAMGAGGELNVAVVVEFPTTPSWRAYYEEVYQEVLARRGGWRGRLVVCRDAELREKDGALRRGDLPVHMVLDGQSGVLGLPIVSALLSGRTRAYNGPVTPMLSHKVNLALLSELEDADLWSDEERAVIRANIPWTRQVNDDFVDYRGERVYLPDLLDSERDRMVLKLGLSRQGADVHAGRFTPPGRWNELVRAALERGGWIAQEFQQCLRWPYLDVDEKRVVPHDSVWGMFIVGGHFAGGFLRVLPAGRAGVLNTLRGARPSVLFEVAETE